MKTKKSERRFVCPVLLGYNKRFTTGMQWEDCPFAFRILPVRKMGGTMRTTTWSIQWVINGKRKEINFTWRPDVTHYYWIRQPRLNKRSNA